MTLPASGELGLIEIWEEIFPIAHADSVPLAVVSLIDMYDFSTLTPKSTNIAVSDFYSYTTSEFIFLDITAVEIIFLAGGHVEVSHLTANEDWSVTLQPTWITIDSANSGTYAWQSPISFTATKNEGGDRVGTVRFKLDSFSDFVDLVITQTENPLP